MQLGRRRKCDVLLRCSLALLLTAAPSSDAFLARAPLGQTSLSLTRASPSTVPDNVKEVWGIEPRIDNFPGAHFPLGTSDRDGKSPPILELPNFLTAQECAQIRNWASHAIENGADECDDYLNYRVNKEVEEGGESQEGKALIEESALSETELSATNKGGFRIRLDDEIVEGMLKERLLDVLGMPDRKFVFEEGAWIRPTPRTIVVRDKTVVFYDGGDGVPPHVDGKDGTLLVYLSNGECKYNSRALS